MFLVFTISVLSNAVNVTAHPQLQEAPSGITYYVNGANGSDTNPGTQAQPWKTIQKCLNQVQPGSTCLTAGGNYNESLVLKISGTGSARITIQNYNNQIVTVNSGASRTLVTSGNINYYTIDGIQFISAANPVDQSDSSLHFSLNYWGDGHLYEKGNDGFILRNCYIEGAVYFYGSDNIVENCELNGLNKWMNGIIERSQPSENNVYRNNTIHNYTKRGGWSMQLTDNTLWQGNTVYQVGQMGFDCDGAGNPVKRCNLVNNRVYDIQGEGIALHLENAFNSVVDGNKIYNVTNAIVSINYGPPIAPAEYRTTNTNSVIKNNVIYNTVNSGILCKGSPGGKAFNNTIFNTSQTPGYWAAIALTSYQGYYCHNWEIKNNIVSQSKKYAYWLEGPPSGLTNLLVDYNSLDFGAAEKKINWVVQTSSNAVSTTYTLAQFQSQKNQDKHTILGNPLFINVNGSDFHLAQNSPLIDRGYHLGSLVLIDFDGTLRPQGLGFDMGAYELLASPIYYLNKLWLPLILRNMR